MGIWDKIKSAATTVGGYALGGPVGAIAGAVGGKIIGGTKDAFSADNVTAAQTTAADYQYGGDPSVRDAAVARTNQRGESSYDVLTDVGTRNYLDAMAGSKALEGASGQALNAGVASSADAALLSKEAKSQYQRSPTMFGDQDAMRSWQVSAANLKGYQPSAASAQATDSLMGFDRGQVDSRLGDSYSQLQNYSQREPGTSAAERQLTQSLDANVASQVALARSGRGAGASANAARQAAFQAANIGQRTAAEAATLRANEEAVWRGQQLQAINAAGGLAGNIESAAQARSGLGLQALTSGAQLSQATDAQRLQAQQAAAGQYGSIFGSGADAQQAAAASRQGYLSQAMGAQQAGAAQQSAAYQTYVAGLVNAANLSQEAGQNNLSARQAGLSARSAYDQQAIAIQEAENQRRAQLAMANAGQLTSASVANQGADAAQDARTVGLFSGLIEAGVKAGGAK